MSLIKNGEVFYVIDAETTGYDPADSDVIQLSAIKVYNDNGEYEVQGTFNEYINPGYPLPPDIVDFNKRNKTGITDELLSESPTADVVISDFVRFMGDDLEPPTMVFHHAAFDKPFIDKMTMVHLGFKYNANIVDTLDISRDCLPDVKHNLGAMFALTDKKYSADNPDFHNALSDVYATLDVLDYLEKEYFSSALDLTDNQGQGGMARVRQR